jgi:pyruvate dehydrogenase E2 component (dihydrolipoamide acetyltransferase)
MRPGQTAGPATSVAQTQAVEGGRVKASPAARKLAEELGIVLGELGAGSGPGGRILSTDVAAARGDRQPNYKQPEIGVSPRGQVRRRMSQMRKAIARNLLWSKQNIPHFYLRLTVNAEPLLAFYKQEKAKYPCSVNDVVAAACAKAVHEFPAFRCKLDGGDLIETPTANIGVAVGMEEGLAVPVIIAAERLTLQQIGAESKRLAEAARKGKIEGMGEGVFTLTNLGMFGVEEFAAIINPPEAAILAVGAAHEAAVVKDGSVRAGRVMNMTLSCDHRIVDGLLGAKFLARMKELLENPGELGARGEGLGTKDQ